MNTWKGRYLQTAGAILQAVAAFILVAAGAEEEIVLLLPGAIVGVGGLVLWGKGAREKLLNPAEPEPLVQSPRIAEAIAALQEDIASLREDREFYKELYSGSPGGRDAPSPYSTTSPGRRHSREGGNPG